MAPRTDLCAKATLGPVMAVSWIWIWFAKARYDFDQDQDQVQGPSLTVW
jgi:hypothetical protein